LTRLWVAAVAALLFATQAAASAVVLGSNIGNASLEGHLAHFADTSTRLDFNTARQQTFAVMPQFRSQGYDAATHWYRFELDRAPNAPASWVLTIGMPYLDEVDVWVAQPDGGFKQFQLGDHRPYADRPIKSRLFAVPITIEKPTTVYLRVHSISAINITASVWQPDAFIAAEARTNLYQGVYFGILLIVVVFYLIWGFWLRDIVVASYATYVASLIPLYLGLNGYLPVAFPQPAPWLGDAILGASVLAAIAILPVMWERMLDLRQHFPRIRRLYQAICLSAIAMLPFVATPAYRVIAPVMSQTGVVYVAINLVLLLILWRRSRRTELLIYAIAFVATVSGCVTQVAMAVGWFPQNVWTSNAYQAASLIHVLVMSFGLALRLRQMQQDKALAEQEVALSTQRAEEQRRFVAMLSHEFRTPLAAIDRAAQMIHIKTPNLAQPETERLVHIRTNVDTLSGLVDNFLVAEALDNGAFVISREHCTIGTLLEGVAKNMRDSTSERIRMQVTPPDAAYDLDPTLIGMAIGNLVGNALRYSPSDSPVAVSAIVDGDGLLIHVSNHGPGMAPEEMAMLGMPYYRASSSIGKKGTGLGYHFTRYIVEAHGGSLQAYSREGSGMEVAIWLPRPAKYSASSPTLEVTPAAN